MKQVLRIILIYLTFLSSNSLFAQVQGKFGNTQSALDVNAALEVESTSKGVLLPRLTTAQQNAMSAPTNGMLIYNTDSACFVLRRAGVWRSLCAANGGEAWSTLGNTGTNVNTNFLGTTDNVGLVFKTNNMEQMRLTEGGHLLVGTPNYLSGWISGANVQVYRTSAGADLRTVIAGGNTYYMVHNSSAQAPLTYYHHSRGTEAAPSALLANDGLGAIYWNGQNGAGTGNQPYLPRIEAIVTDFTGTNQDALLTLRSGRLNRIGPDLLIAPTGFVGISANAHFTSSNLPTYALDVQANANPLRLQGLQAGAISDSIISSNSGIIRRLGINQLLANAWNITGNSNIINGTHFLGTTNDVPLSIRINNVNAGRISRGNLSTAIGYESQNAITTANSNTSVGYQALQSATTGSYNTALGVSALRTNVSGEYNIAIGNNSLLSMTSGSGNVGIGYSVLAATTTAGANVAIGNNAAAANTTGTGNTVMGSGTLINNTTGSSNSAVGTSTLNSNSIGELNNAFGFWALYSNTTGVRNSALGSFALHGNSTGSSNVAIGNNALYNANADRNVALGHYVGTRVSTGTDNLLLGNESGDYITTGARNVVLGYQSGSLITTGSNNTFIGVGTNVTAGGSAFTNATAIGANAVVGASNSLILGGTGANAVNVGIGTTTPTSTLQVNGSFSTAISTKTAAYTATTNDHILIGNATTAAFTITLPTAVGIAGRQYIIKKTDASVNAVTIATTGGQTIDGAATVSLSIQWQTKTVASDGANWLIISNQ